MQKGSLPVLAESLFSCFAYSRGIPAFAQAARVASSQTLACTSPMWRCPAAACTDALADAAADGVGQLTVQHCLVEGQGAAVVTACHGQLPVHALGADADTMLLSS